jgi:hypothetical protein
MTTLLGNMGDVLRKTIGNQNNKMKTIYNNRLECPEPSMQFSKRSQNAVQRKVSTNFIAPKTSKNSLSGGYSYFHVQPYKPPSNIVNTSLMRLCPCTPTPACDTLRKSRVSQPKVKGRKLVHKGVHGRSLTAKQYTKIPTVYIPKVEENGLLSDMHGEASPVAFDN